MRQTVLALTMALAVVRALAGDADAAGENRQLVRLDTRPDVTLDFLLIEPGTPVASLILMEGGGGDLKLSGTETDHHGFLATSRDRFAAHGLVVALVDAPSDKKGARGMAGGFRSTGKHVKDISSVVAWLKQKYALPVWLVGISRGTQSAVYVAIHSKQAVAGLVLASSMAKVKDKSIPVPAMDLDKIAAPTLIIAHERDGCEVTPPQGAEEIRKGLANAATVDVRYFDGGRAAGKDPCNPRSHHTFYGIEDGVVAAIAEFVKTHAAAPGKP